MAAAPVPIAQESDEEVASSSSGATSDDAASPAVLLGPRAAKLGVLLLCVAVASLALRKAARGPSAMDAAALTGLAELDPLGELVNVRGFGPYVGYAGTLKVKGTVAIGDSDEGLLFHRDLIGLDPKCLSGPGEAPNSCTLHITTGKSCTMPAGENYQPIGVTADLWLNNTYKERTGWSDVAIDFNSSDVIGHALIVSDYAGVKIACGIVGHGHDMFAPYVGYQGNLTVTGATSVKETESNGTQLVDWVLKGVDPECTEPKKDKPNSCGIHIHTGTSCSENAGGHYFSADLEEDPWKLVTYTAKDGSASGEAAVATGLTQEEAEAHTLIVHDIDGGRISCAIIRDSCRQAAQVGGAVAMAMVTFVLLQLQ